MAGFTKGIASGRFRLTVNFLSKHALQLRSFVAYKSL